MLEIGVIILLGIIGAAAYFYEKKGLTLSADEQIIINSIVTEKQKLLADFVSGKEVLISEYESLKADVAKAIGLQAKLPVAPIMASSPAPQQAIVNPQQGPLLSVPPVNILPVVAVEAPIVAEPVPPQA